MTLIMLWRFPNPKHVILISTICSPRCPLSTVSYDPVLLQAGAPLFRQLTNAYSEENAVEDALYFLGRALGEGALECDGYLKQVFLTQGTSKAFMPTRKSRPFQARRKGPTSKDLFQVRVLSRRQFLLRETMNRCRRKAGLDL